MRGVCAERRAERGSSASSRRNRGTRRSGRLRSHGERSFTARASRARDDYGAGPRGVARETCCVHGAAGRIIAGAAHGHFCSEIR